MFIIFASYFFSKDQNSMKVAIVIKDKERMLIGDCLSDAHVFYIYNAKGRLLDLVPPPQCLRHLRAETYAAFLGDHLVKKVAAKDFGPKAKASLVSKSIEWFQIGEAKSITDMIEIMLK